MKYEGPRFPPEYAKPTFVYPDNLVELAEEFWGEAANVVAISDTMLPAKPAETKGKQT